jgi:hypothetical protein
MSQRGFNFGFIPSGGSGGTGFDSTNSFSSVENLAIGVTTIITTMTKEPKFISVFDSSDINITSSLSISFLLNLGVYEIKINSGVAINNVKVSVYGA